LIDSHGRLSNESVLADDEALHKVSSMLPVSHELHDGLLYGDAMLHKWRDRGYGKPSHGQNDAAYDA